MDICLECPNPDYVKRTGRCFDCVGDGDCQDIEKNEINVDMYYVEDKTNTSDLGWAVNGPSNDSQRRILCRSSIKENADLIASALNYFYNSKMK